MAPASGAPPELPKRQAGPYQEVMLEAGQGFLTLLDDVMRLTRNDDESWKTRIAIRCKPPGRSPACCSRRALGKRLRLALTAAPTCRGVAADPRRVRQALLSRSPTTP